MDWKAPQEELLVARSYEEGDDSEPAMEEATGEFAVEVPNDIEVTEADPKIDKKEKTNSKHLKDVA